MTAPPATYLDHYLGPLLPFLELPDVTDLYINKPGELWLEKLGGQIERHEVAGLDDAHLWRLAHQLASQSHQGISRRHPLMAASLPNGSRVQIVAPPATRGQMAIAIRRHVAATLPLSTYGDIGLAEPGSSSESGSLQSLLVARDYPGFLAAAVRARLNIVLSGGTSTGKTTLLNALLAEVPLHERLLFIEDAPELRLDHPNSVGLVAVRGAQGEAEVTSLDLLQAALRMRPDRIIVGELRGAEAFTFLRAINTGHPGSMTTIHADSPERATVQLALMALQAGLGVSYSDVLQLVRSMVDVIVQVERRDKQRRISQVFLVNS